MGKEFAQVLVAQLVTLAESNQSKRSRLAAMENRARDYNTNALRHGEEVRVLRAEIAQKAGMITRLEEDVAAINTRFVNTQRALDTAYKLLSKGQRTKLARQVKAYAAATDKDDDNDEDNDEDFDEVDDV